MDSIKYQGIPIICHLLGKQDVFVSDEQLGDGETLPVDVFVEKATVMIKKTTYITSLHLWFIYLYITISISLCLYTWWWLTSDVLERSGPWLRQSISYQMDYASEVSPVQKVIQLMPARRVSVGGGLGKWWTAEVVLCSGFIVVNYGEAWWTMLN